MVLKTGGQDPSTTHGTLITHFCVARRQGVKMGGEALIPYLPRLLEITMNNGAVPGD